MEYINIQSILQQMPPERRLHLPAFVIRLIEKIIRQKEMNRLLSAYGHLSPSGFLEAIIREFRIDLQVEGMENFPSHSRCFFVANHPFGIADGLALVYLVQQRYGSLKAIGNEAFMFIPPLKPFMVAVNVFGRNSKTVVEQLNKIYSSDIAITHFPAGEVSRRYHKKIEDLPWQKSFITKAVSCRRDVVPVYFYGSNSWLFHAIYRLRKILQIKTNLELVLLPHEMFNKKGKTIRIKIGKPIPWHRFDRSCSPYEWAQKVRKYVYEMGNTNQIIDFY